MTNDLHMDYADMAYMQAAIKEASPNEIGFLGIIVIENGTAWVRHLEILEQEVSSGGVDFDDEGFAKYLERRIERNELPEGDFGIYSAHSHGTMGVWWSSTDEDGIKRYLRGAPWLFSSVFNTKGEAKHRVDIGVKGHSCPLMNQLSITSDSVTLTVVEDPDVAKLQAEIDEIKRDLFEQAKKDAEADCKAFVRYSYSRGTKLLGSQGWKSSSSQTGGTKQLPPKAGKGSGANGNGKLESNGTVRGDGSKIEKTIDIDSLNSDKIKGEKLILIDADPEMGEAILMDDKNCVYSLDLSKLFRYEIEDALKEGRIEPKDGMELGKALNDHEDLTSYGGYGVGYGSLGWA